MNLDELRQDIEKRIADFGQYARCKDSLKSPIISDYHHADLPAPYVEAITCLFDSAKGSITMKSPDHYLNRSNQLKHRLGNFDRSLKIIHVGGTNGKGSVTTKIAYGLCTAGHKTGALVSPHILSTRERIVVDGRPIDYDEWLGLYHFLRDLVGGESLAFPLCMTVMGMLYFWYMKCEYVVCEIGMGGRYDSTLPFGVEQLSVITSIGYDHMAILGKSREEIGREKAGIIPQGGICLIGPTCADVDSVMEVANQRQATVLLVPPEENFMTENEVLAQAALGLLLKLPATLNYQLPNAMGRFQFVAETSRSQVPVFLDVGHNVSATERVAQLLKERFVGLEKIYAFVALSRKRAPAIFDPLFKVGAKMRLILTPSHHPLLRSWSSQLGDDSPSYHNMISTMESRETYSIAEWVRWVLSDLSDSSPEDIVEVSSWSDRYNAESKAIILIFGSFYHVAEMLEAIKLKHFNPVVRMRRPLADLCTSASTTSSEEHLSASLWKFTVKSPRCFTVPCRAAEDPLKLSNGCSVFFVKGVRPSVTEALGNKNTIWFSTKSGAELTVYSASQRHDLIENSWVETIKYGLAHFFDSPEVPVEVFVEEWEDVFFHHFNELVVGRHGSLTGSKRKYVEVDMSLTTPSRKLSVH